MSRADEKTREFRSYVIGYGLALVLTLIPFAAVALDVMNTVTTLWLIAAFALAQIVVHVRFFLHIDLSGQKREDLQLIVFSVLLFTLMAGGTIWIIANLHMRMMMERAESPTWPSADIVNAPAARTRIRSIR